MLNLHLPSQKSKFWKISLGPKFSDVDELDEMANITLRIFQLRFINFFPIKITTDFALFPNFSNLQILPVNVQIPITRLSAPSMQVRVDIHITYHSWRFTSTCATTSSSTWSRCCLQAANNFCTSFTSSNAICLQIQLSRRLLASWKARNVLQPPRGAAVGCWTSSSDTWPRLTISFYCY